MSVQFNPQCLINKVRKLAAERPETTYNHMECFYARGECSDGSTGCLIGQALLALGVDRELLAEIDPLEGSTGVADLLRAQLAGHLTNEGSEAEMDWLCTVQGAQDYGTKWAAAVAEADQVAQGDVYD